ncbi:Putative auto-transporter adhesin, head GIN domain [Sphingomonas guangdongensis]|uniref:Auto-transporter adhesin, head GIN domain n=1 Tax=Sphingomonas guangdongensis TaxID=1141890 RepID=A0A285QAQ4_9SPHN|nr:head GIN domain-containing protein [Sphingomonas guangdongensis]SOB78901.1 Putative auto-transporter adhesin, head GIN domain [Sphingomonas guangdongensis]
MRTLLVIAAALPLVACGGVSFGNDKGEPAQASGSGGTRTFAVSDFTKVELAGSDDVDVQVGGAFRVTATGPADVLDKLDIRKDGDTLSIGRKREGNFQMSKGPHATITVTMPAIRAANLAGSGDMRVDRVPSGEDFSASLAGSGDLAIAQLDARNVELNIAGSGTIAAGGQVERLSTSIAGAGDVRGANLRAKVADISIAGSGNVVAQVNGNATVSIMGSGDVSLGAGAKCTTSKMGSGTVTCG